MGFGAIDGSDAGLLQLLTQWRKTCDELARLIAEHHGLHTDHGAVDCDSVGPFVIAQLLIGQGCALTASGSNLLESLINDMTEEVTACGCRHPVHGGRPCDLPSVDSGGCQRCRQESH